MALKSVGVPYRPTAFGSVLATGTPVAASELVMPEGLGLGFFLRLCRGGAVL